MSGCAFWQTSRKDHDVKVDPGGSCTGGLLADVNAVTPHAQTLPMNLDDALTLSLRDTPRGLLVVKSDVTTYQTGSMVADGEDGFMPTNDRTSTGPRACPGDNFTTSGDLCEYSDMTCRPAGPRPVIAAGITENLNGPIAGCQVNYVQNGDLDSGRGSYIHDCSDGSAKHPTASPLEGRSCTAEVIRSSNSGPRSRAPGGWQRGDRGRGTPHRRLSGGADPEGQPG